MGDPRGAGPPGSPAPRPAGTGDDAAEARRALRAVALGAALGALLLALARGR